MRGNAGPSRESRLQDFVDWCAAHITGDEKGQAQIFLDRLFVAFSQKGSLDVGGTAEMRIRKSADDGGGTSFADYVWKPVVLIEMKKRGVDLAKHRQQAFDYWTHIAPGRPRYVILCNFDEFWVYDFNNQIYSPKDQVKLTDLPQRWEPLAFLFPTNETPRFGNDREKVTREAADKLATCFRKLLVRKVDRDLAQRFVLQSMIAMFAEDIGLLPKSFFSKLVEECKEPSDSYDLLGGLFEAMNTSPPVTGGRYKGVRYFNGGIFSKPARVELSEDELNQIRGSNGALFGAAQSDWSKVEPEIFGAIFQESMEAQERHAFGAHFTSAVDIMKIVKPTISDPWGGAIDAAKSAKRLNELLERLATLRVLDPACGSGNFLYLAYREMKRLETRIRERLMTEFPEFPPTFAHVNARQFFGMDINSFAVELAKITLMLGRKLAINELHLIGEPDLPLDNLDANFRVGDSLITRTDDGGAIQTPWPKVDVIIGNPPFLGAKRLKPERGADYVNAVRKLYGDVPGMADYCVYWIRRAADHLPPCTAADPFAGRSGLVGTQNIRNNQSRVGGLDHVVKTGTIVEAVDNQPWSGDANVSVSIVNWIKSVSAQVAPETKRLWVKLPPVAGTKNRVSGQRSDKHYELASRESRMISPSLSDGIDLGAAKPIAANSDKPPTFQGVVPGYPGFVLELGDRARMIDSDVTNDQVVRPYLIGDDLVSNAAGPSRAVIDFGNMSQLQARRFKAPWKLVEQNVLPEVDAKAKRTVDSDMAKARADHLERWWQFWNVRVEMRASLERISRYIAIPRVTKRQIVCFVATEITPDCQVQVFAFEDDYSFGILASGAHWQWFIARCSKLTERLRYIRREVFDTFPWPQSPTAAQIDAVAAAGREVRRVREEALKIISGGLRAVYRTLELPGKHPLKDAHAALDAAVLAAYGFNAKKDLLAQLLELNLAVAAKEKANEPVTAPGVPPSYGGVEKLVTADCIRP